MGLHSQPRPVENMICIRLCKYIQYAVTLNWFDSAHAVETAVVLIHVLIPGSMHLLLAMLASQGPHPPSQLGYIGSAWGM